MVAGGTPELILESQRALFGQAVWVSVSDDHRPGEWLEFLLIDSVDVWIDYQTEAKRERFRTTVLKLAELLGYQVAARDSQQAEPDAAASGEGL